jgi:hypothetical protein
MKKGRKEKAPTMLECPCLGNLEPDIETQVNICFLMHSAQGEGLPDEKNRRLFKSDISNLTKMMGEKASQIPQGYRE